MVSNDNGSGSESRQFIQEQRITGSLGDLEIQVDNLEELSPTASHDTLIPSYSGTAKKSGYSNNDLEKQEAPQSSRYTKRQWLVLTVYGCTQFCTGSIISLQAPFYPAEAEKKGVTASEYGFVFGVYEFTIFLVSFFYGKYMVKVGPKFAYNTGLFVTGISTILFGFLDRVEDRTPFFALSMITRIIEALGSAASVNGAFSIIATEFPNSVATVVATMGTLFGAGIACGPIIGGALFQLGGFTVPFATSGSLLVAVAIFTFFVLPSPSVSTQELDRSKNGLITLLKIPTVLISLLAIFTASLSIGYLASTMEPHIRRFNLSPVEVGLVLVLSGLFYGILAPFWGRMVDKKPEWVDYYTLAGSLLAIAGFLLIGPAPFLPFDTILWVTCVGLVLQGSSLGGCLTPSLIRCFRIANEHGFPDGVATYSMLSGLWTSFFSLGNFAGPIISGILYDAVGFRYGSLFVIGLHTIVTLLFVCKICTTGKASGTKAFRRSSDINENSSLLANKK